MHNIIQKIDCSYVPIVLRYDREYESLLYSYSALDDKNQYKI
jgi:hypothetical protein